MLLFRRSSFRESHRTAVVQCITGGGISASLQLVPWVRNDPCDRTGGDGQRTGEVDTRLLVAHAAGEIAIRCADAAERLIEPAERVARSAQTRRARRLADLRSRGEEDFLQRFATKFLRLEVRRDLG